MKTLLSQTSTNRFPLLLVSVATFLAGIVFTWITWHIYHLNEDTIWSVSAIIVIFIASLLAWLTTFHRLYQSRQSLLIKIAERKQTEEKLNKNERFLRTVLENITDGIVACDAEGTLTLFNKATRKFHGLPQIPLAPEEWAEHYNLYYADAKTPMQVKDVPLYRALQEGGVEDVEMVIKPKNGLTRTVISSGQALFDEHQQKLGAVVVMHDITERKRTENALLESERYQRTLLENINEGLVQVDVDDVIEFVNNRLCEMVGYSPDELMRTNWTRLLLDDKGRDLVEQVNERRRKGISDRYEMRLKKKSGETLWVIVGGAPIVNAEGIVTGSMGVFTDITERKRAEEQLLHDAFHDGLTGLANRALFMDHLRMTIERGRSLHSNSYAILFLDFDRFKVINDSLGHTEGDLLLKQIARRLESSTRTGDLVARLGGDEFVVLLCEMLAESDAVQIAQRIQTSLKKPFDLSSGEVFVSASIGIALSTAGHKRAEDMLRDADIAMYRAKAEGRARYQVFDQAMHEHASKQLQLENEMRQALERHEFELHYQPIINLETNELAGFEALVRWIHPQRGIISSMEFIPAAEETGLILPLGRWILDESCRQLRNWQNGNPAAARLTVSVNLSCKQFLQSDLAEQVAETLTATGLAPRCLKLEITESHLMENSEKSVNTMKRLHRLGVELSLDDFGTGYSSLSYLHRLSVDYLKIDRSFVSRMTESNENSEIVFTIIKLAQSLKMKVLAEGIETADQLEHLKNLHCEFGQGYFFSKPLEAKAAEIFIDANLKNSNYMINQPIINLELNT